QVNLVIMFWTRGKVEVILERHADEISHGILRLLHQLFFAGFLLAGLLQLRSLSRKRPEQKKRSIAALRKLLSFSCFPLSLSCFPRAPVFRSHGSLAIPNSGDVALIERINNGLPLF